MNKTFLEKTKILGATGALCAMGGYICGDKVDEHDKLELERQPYEIAREVMEEAAQKQNEWLARQEKLNSTISYYKITIDSLQRIARQLNGYVRLAEDLKRDKESCADEKIVQNRECKETKDSLIYEKAKYENAYQTEQNEVRIRDNQLDSLENLVKAYAKEYTKLQDEYKNRAPIENEFQAIHNCVNAHGENMYSYQYERQVKCCIKQIKKLQKEYPNDKLQSFTIRCNE